MDNLFSKYFIIYSECGTIGKEKGKLLRKSCSNWSIFFFPVFYSEFYKKLNFFKVFFMDIESKFGIDIMLTC